MGAQSTGRRRAGQAALAALTAAGLVLGATAAEAQWYGYRDSPIPPGAVVGALMRQGFLDVSRPRFDGEVYVVEGVDARGLSVRLVIDAYDGAVLSRARLERPLLPPRDVGPPRGRAGDPFEEADDLPPPPRSMPPRGERFGDPRERGPDRSLDPHFDRSWDTRRQIEPRRVERQGDPSNPDRSGTDRRAARAEPPAPAKPSAKTTQPKAAEPKSSEPKTTPAHPAEATAPKEPLPATAAVAPPTPAKPEATPATAPAPASKREPAAAAGEPPAAGAAPSRSVRVIQGVTPVPQGLPQAAPVRQEAAKPSVEPKSSGDPAIVPPATLE